MPGAGEARRRELRLVQGGEMIAAAQRVRELGPDGYAGLDEDSADAMAALVEVIAGEAREGTNARVWEQATRVARSILVPPKGAAPAGPLPGGYESAHTEPFVDDVGDAPPGNLEEPE